MKIPSFPAIALAAVALLTAATGNRQVTQNEKSPSADTSVAIGGTHITIEYNAPSARGREVEGGLIPNARIYRMGADAATTMTTDKDIMLGDLKVPAGVHTLYLEAAGGGASWQLVVNNQTKQWGTVYNKDQDLGRTTMKVTKLDSPVETFKIALTAKELAVEWGHSKATVPIKAK
jgi:hypothetical protein